MLHLSWEISVTFLQGFTELISSLCRLEGPEGGMGVPLGRNPMNCLSSSGCRRTAAPWELPLVMYIPWRAAPVALHDEAWAKIVRIRIRKMHQDEENGELPIFSDQCLILFLQSLGRTVEQIYSISLKGRRVGTGKGRKKASITFTLTTTRIEFVNSEEKGTLSWVLPQITHLDFLCVFYPQIYPHKQTFALLSSRPFSTQLLYPIN